MSKNAKPHPWSKGFPKVVSRKAKKPRGDVEAMYEHRVKPKEGLETDNGLEQE